MDRLLKKSQGKPMMRQEEENDLQEYLLILFTANPYSSQGKACEEFLHRLDVGGEKWEDFFLVVDTIARQIISSKAFSNILPSHFNSDQILDEFRKLTYETWLPEYLDKELLKDEQNPRSFRAFLCDKFNYHLNNLVSNNRSQPTRHKKPDNPQAEKPKRDSCKLAC